MRHFCTHRRYPPDFPYFRPLPGTPDTVSGYGKAKIWTDFG
jgi:hypothetical protein